MTCVGFFGLAHRLLGARAGDPAQSGGSAIGKAPVTLARVPTPRIKAGQG